MAVDPEAARAGDRAALEELLRERRTEVVRYAMRLCISPADAEDAVQETLIDDSVVADRRTRRLRSITPLALRDRQHGR
ncbi:MAG TPA: sigma factor [Kofleriaceae bacterium]